VVYSPGGGKPREEAGRFTLYRVLAGLAATYGQDVLEACDAHSQVIHEAGSAVFDPRTPCFRNSVVRDFDCLGLDLLVIGGMVLAPKWRGLRLGLLALRKLLDLHEPGCGLVVCRPYAEGAQGEVREGTVKLRRHLKQLGFRRLRRTEFYALSPAHANPRFEDLLRNKA
jgi:hypothetical protein